MGLVGGSSWGVPSQPRFFLGTEHLPRTVLNQRETAYQEGSPPASAPLGASPDLAVTHGHSREGGWRVRSQLRLSPALKHPKPISQIPENNGPAPPRAHTQAPGNKPSFSVPSWSYPGRLGAAWRQSVLMARRRGQGPLGPASGPSSVLINHARTSVKLINFPEPGIPCE